MEHTRWAMSRLNIIIEAYASHAMSQLYIIDGVYALGDGSNGYNQ